MWQTLNIINENGTAASEGGMPWYDTILFPFMWVIGWILKLVHVGLGYLALPTGEGIAWILAIVGLTIIVRAALIPLFVKQIKAGRAMQMAQPELNALREKYKGKRDQDSQMRMMEEQKAIQKKYGASMSASCLPMLVQMPVFFSLYRILYHLHALKDGSFYGHTTIGGMGKVESTDLLNSHLFGSSLGISFGAADSTISTKILVAVMVIYLMVTMFLQTRYLTFKNMSDEQLNSDNPMMKSTKYMMYGMPFVYLMSGPVVQIGLLVYWVTNNTWTLIQQFFLVRAYPMRGSAAARWRSDAHEKKYEKYRVKAEEKLETQTNDLFINPGGRNEKALEAAKRDLRRNYLRDLAKYRMELGLPEINVGSLDTSDKGGQRMQPGQKGWAQYQARLTSEENPFADEKTSIDPDAKGKDGLTAAERGTEQAQRRAVQRAAAKKRNKNRKKRN